jgi:hypothetical protein
MLFAVQQARGQWLIREEYGFKINVPDQWQSTQYEENGKLILKLISTDNNILIEFDAFKVDRDNTVFDLVSSFEKNQLPTGFECSSLKDYTTVNNINGKMAIYNGYINGIAESFSAFYTIHAGDGYIFSTLVPIEKIQEKSEEVQAVLDSFELLSKEQKSE